MSGKCATFQVLLVLFREMLMWAIIILGKRIPPESLTPDYFILFWESLHVAVPRFGFAKALLCVGQVGRCRVTLGRSCSVWSWECREMGHTGSCVNS